MQYLATAGRLALISAFVVVLAASAAPADEPGAATFLRDPYSTPSPSRVGTSPLPLRGKSANLLSNGGAEEPAKTDTTLPGWFPAVVPAAELRWFVDGNHSRSGNACLAISNQHQYDQIVCNNWAQKIDPVPIGKTVRLSGYIRTDEAATVNICVQCWTAGEEQLIGFSSTPVFHGTHGWTLAEAAELLVPPNTKLMFVRAALTGKGNAYFDDVSLDIVDSSAVAAAAPANTEMSEQLPVDLAGRIVQQLPLLKDSMVLAYLAGWNHGNVDNIAVANNNGGVRTLLAWEQPAQAKIAQPRLRFVLAMYSRKTTLGDKPGSIAIHELVDDWDETTSWEKQPRFEEAVAEFKMSPGEGWKFFDVTPLVRQQASSPRPNRGVVLRFATGAPGDKEWSGYAFVSREGIGEWQTRRPALLVVDPNEPVR